MRGVKPQLFIDLIDYKTGKEAWDRLARLFQPFGTSTSNRFDPNVNINEFG